MFKGNILFANKHANNEKMWPPAAQSLDNLSPVLFYRWVQANLLVQTPERAGASDGFKL